MNIDEMPAGHDLDLLIARDVMGMALPIEYGIRYKDGKERWGQSEEYTRQKCANYIAQGVAECLISRPDLAGWEPSTNIANAWEVVERLKITIGPYRSGEVWAAEIHMPEYFIAFGRTAPLAICRAALKATKIKTNKTEITP